MKDFQSDLTKYLKKIEELSIQNVLENNKIKDIVSMVLAYSNISRKFDVATRTNTIKKDLKTNCNNKNSQNFTLIHSYP